MSAKQSSQLKIYIAATLNLHVTAQVTLRKQDYFMPQQKVYITYEVSPKNCLLH